MVTQFAAKSDAVGHIIALRHTIATGRGCWHELCVYCGIMEWRGGNHIIPADFRDDHLPEKDSDMTNIRDFATGRLLAKIEEKSLNKWCDENGYLPHRHKAGCWFVIKA